MSAKRNSMLLAIAISLGLLVPPLAALAAPLLQPVIFCLLVFPLLQMERGALVAAMTRPVLTVALAAWVVLAMPWITWGACRLLAVPDFLLTPLLVTACTGTVFSAPAFCRLLGLDDALALVAMLASTLLMPVSLLVHGAVLLPHALDLDLAEYLRRLGLFIVCPALLAAAIRRVAGPARMARARPYFAHGMLAVLALFGLAIMDGVTARALAAPGEVAGYLAAAFAFNFGAQALTALVCLPAGTHVAVTAALLAGYRNLGVVIGITAGMLDDAFLIFAGVWQIPMYVLPLLMQPLYRRLGRHAAGDAP